jgi:hypothetical protein
MHQLLFAKRHVAAQPGSVKGIIAPANDLHCLNPLITELNLA